MVTTVTANPGPVLTETQAKTLATLKAVAASGQSGASSSQTAAEAAQSARIRLPGLLLAAGSAAATGDIRAASGSPAKPGSSPTASAPASIRPRQRRPAGARRPRHRRPATRPSPSTSSSSWR